MWHTSDGGETWSELESTGPSAWIRDVEVDWNNPLRVYVGFADAGVRGVWRVDVTDAGAVWFDATGATPSSSLPPLAITAMALDAALLDTVYAATMLGVYRSINAGHSWSLFGEGLPNCLVTDMTYRRHGHALYASTFGRGVYRLRC